MKKQFTNSLVLGLTLGVSLPLSAGAVWAQTQAPVQQSPGASSEVSDQELQAFAKSYVEFHKMRTIYEPQVGVAETPEEKTRIQQRRWRSSVQYSNGRFDDGTLCRSLKPSMDDRLREKVIKLIEDERRSRNQLRCGIGWRQPADRSTAIYFLMTGAQTKQTRRWELCK
jgi:hypothetical protein